MSVLDETTKQKMLQARKLISEHRYEEARKILKSVNHPTAQKWLIKLDQIAPNSSKKLLGFRKLLGALIGFVVVLTLVVVAYLIGKNSGQENKNRTSDTTNPPFEQSAANVVELEPLTGNITLELHHDDAVIGAKWNQAGTQILSWSEDGTVRLWDAASGEQLRVLVVGTPVYGALWNHDETRILAWSGQRPNIGRRDFSGAVHVWDANTGTTLLTLTHDNPVYGASWNSNETRILTWSGFADIGLYTDKISGSAQVWDANTGARMLDLPHKALVNGALWNRAETFILTWSDDFTLRLWDAQTGDALQIMRQGQALRGVALNADETRLISWARGGPAIIWNITTGTEQLSIPHMQTVSGAAWSEDENSVLTWSNASGVKVSNAVTGKALWNINLMHPVPSGSIKAFWSKDQTRILTWADHEAIVLDAMDGSRLTSMPHITYVKGASWSQDNRMILSWSGELEYCSDHAYCPAEIKVWNSESGSELLTITIEEEINGAIWNASENQILFWTENGTVNVWKKAE